MENPKPEKDVMAHIVERNIRALLERRHSEQRRKGVGDRIADKVTRFSGSMLFVYIHIIFVAAWIAWNLGWMGLKPFDPTFVVLAMFASVEAIFLSTFVLITQNRMNAEADKRADLDLQISLLAEHEITHLIHLVTAMAKHMNIEEAHNPELEELKMDVQPEKVMDTMEKHAMNIDKNNGQ